MLRSRWISPCPAVYKEASSKVPGGGVEHDRLPGSPHLPPVPSNQKPLAHRVSCEVSREGFSVGL